MKSLRRLWPRGWQPDQRTLGLLIFGFFGAAAVAALVYAGSDLSQALNLQTPGEISFVPSSLRIQSGAQFLGGVADLVAALGGLALMADRSWARFLTVAGVGVAGAAVLVTLVLAPFGAALPSLAILILDIAIVFLVMWWDLRPAGEGWRLDQRTLGLLIFGFFGVAAVSVLVYSGSEISQALNARAPDGASSIPTWVRVASGNAFVAGIADLVAAVGGLALMADLSWARVVTASSVGVAAAALVVSVIVAPFGAAGPSLGNLILDIAIVVLVMRWQPRRSGTRLVSSGNSGGDAGTEAAPQSG